MTKRYTLLLYIVCVLFLLLYSMLCWHSRLASDDYSFIWDVYNNGIFKGTSKQYMLWCGRYAAKLAGYVIYKYWDTDQTYYFLLPLLSMTAIIFGVYKSIANISSHYNFPITLSHKWLLTLTFAALLFFTTIDTGETWFWYNALSDYLWSVVAFIWGLAFLYSHRNILLSLLAGIFCLVYVGGASEVYSLVLGQFFLLLIYDRYKKNNHRFLSDAFNRKTIIVFSFFLISFLITIIAPGNYERANFFPKPGFISTIRLCAYMSGKLFFWFLPKKIAYIIGFASPFIIIGNYYNTGTQFLRKDFLKNIKLATGLLLLNCLLVFGLIAFLMSQSGEYRIWFILSFLFTVYCCSICFYAGYTGLLTNKSVELLKKAGILIALIAVSYTLIGQYSIAKKYSEMHDQRVHFLLDTNTQIRKDTTIQIAPLPPSGMLYSSDITDDPAYYVNEEWKQGYRLKFHIISKKKMP